jgi:hypothetical protein
MDPDDEAVVCMGARAVSAEPSGGARRLRPARAAAPLAVLFVGNSRALDARFRHSQANERLMDDLPLSADSEQREVVDQFAGRIIQFHLRDRRVARDVHQQHAPLSLRFVRRRRARKTGNIVRAGPGPQLSVLHPHHPSFGDEHPVEMLALTGRVRLEIVILDRLSNRLAAPLLPRGD